MLTRQQTGFGFLALVAALYFFSFVPVNLTGAADPNMLAVFETDEFAIFPSVFRIFNLGDSVYETFKNFVGYSPRFYGYPFFFIYGVAIAPLRLLLPLADGNALETMVAYNTAVIPTEYTYLFMLVLRQLSPLLMVAAILLLVNLWTNFKDGFRSVALFLFLGFIPALFKNNTWLHPDSLVTLFVVLTIFAFCQDQLRFGRWFYWAAVFCGLATATKVLGVFFLPTTVPVYLLLGLKHRSLSLPKAIRVGIGFYLLSFLVVFVTNPLLWVPQGAQIVLDSITSNSENLKYGFGGVPMPKGFVAWYAAALRQGFGYWWIYLLANVSGILGIVYDRHKRLLNIIILSWALPFFIYVIFCVSSGPRDRFFIPILLPLLSCLGNPILWRFRQQITSRIAAFGLVLLILCGFQLADYSRFNFEQYGTLLHKEKNNPALAFYQALENQYLSQLPADTQLVIYREPSIYIPPKPQFEVEMRWKFTDYDDLAETQPDLVLLNLQSAKERSNQKLVEVSQSSEAAQKNYEFYRDVLAHRVKDFEPVVETDFAVALKRTSTSLAGTAPAIP